MLLPGVSGVSVEGERIVVFAEEGYNYDNIDGVKVTCMKAGKVKGLELSVNSIKDVSSEIQLREQVWRPFPGGVSGGYTGTTAGTLGMKVKKNGEQFILSNTHIFGEKLGADVLQPAPLDGGTESDRIGTTSEFVKIKYGEINEVDAALASLDYTNEAAENILDIGIVKGTKKPSLLMGVEKSGRSTGLTHGRVIGTNGYFKVFYDREDGEKSAFFKGVTVTNRMGEPGDSGSILVSNNKAVGLLFAGSKYVTLYVPMWLVEKTLGIEIG